jgi:hypothetical protein
VGSEIERPAEFELLAASLRADSGDVVTFMETLAAKLESVLPGGVSVERGRGRGRLFGPKTVRRIVTDLGGERLELGFDGASDRVQARRARVSGGITLSTEPLSIEAWSESLSEALAREAEHSVQTRHSLERLLLG